MRVPSWAHRRSILLASTFIAIGVDVAAPSMAQVASPAPAARTGEVELENIIVTATRRKAPLQKIPVSVYVISGKEFTNSGFKNPSDLQFLSSSMQVTASGGVSYVIRGVGNNSFNAATEQAVGLVIDGVTYGFVSDLSADLTAVEDVEVLRGPQGTTFGKNSSAGVVSITTKRPSTAAVTADFHATYGSRNDTNSYLNVNVPITPRLATMFSVAYQNQDGFVYNPVRHEEEGDFNQLGYRAKALYNPTDELSLFLNADFRQERAHPLFLSTYRSVGVDNGLGIFNYGIVPAPNNTETGAKSDAAELLNTGGVSLEANYKFGPGLTLSSISAFRFTASKNSATLGATPIELLNFASTDHGTQVSQEFRLTSPASGFFQYVAGAYYYDRLTHDTSLSEGALASGLELSDNNVRNYAVFAEGTSHITDRFRFVTGGRLTYDQAYGNLDTVNVPSGVTVNPPAHVSVQDRNFSWRVGPEYDITDNVMGYATASEGYKGALAVPVQGGAILHINPESGRAYEVGVKSTLFDNRLLFNIDAFYEHFKDFQTSVLDTQLNPPEFELGNAGGLTTKGVELDLTARPIPELTLHGGVTYQYAYFTNFATSCYYGQNTTANSNGVGGCYYSSPTATGFTQAAGSPLNDASRWTFTGSASYQHPLSEQLIGDANVDTLYRTAFYTDGYIPGTRVGGYDITNLNVGVSDVDDRWRIGFYARNLFDRYFVGGIETGIFDQGAYTNVIAPQARRTIGVQLDYHFE